MIKLAKIFKKTITIGNNSDMNDNCRIRHKKSSSQNVSCLKDLKKEYYLMVEAFTKAPEASK